MRTIKKFVAAGAVTLLLVAGVGTPAQAAKGGGMQPMEIGRASCRERV